MPGVILSHFRFAFQSSSRCFLPMVLHEGCMLTRAESACSLFLHPSLLLDALRSTSDALSTTVAFASASLFPSHKTRLSCYPVGMTRSCSIGVVRKSQICLFSHFLTTGIWPRLPGKPAGLREFKALFSLCHGCAGSEQSLPSISCGMSSARFCRTGHGAMCLVCDPEKHGIVIIKF